MEDGKDAVGSTQLSTFKEREEVARDVMPCSAKIAFNALMLREGSCELYEKYFEHGGEHDWKMTEWEFKGGRRTRSLTYKKPLNVAMVNKVVNCIETHYLSFTKDGGFIYEVDLYNPDVPSGNAFRVESFWEFKARSESATEVCASVKVKWTGRSMFKKMVESGTKSDVTVSYAKLLAIAKRLCSAFSEKMTTSNGTRKVALRSRGKGRANARERGRAPPDMSTINRPQAPPQPEVEKVAVEEVHNISSLIMNIVLFAAFILLFWLLLSVVRLNHLVSDEIELLRRTLRHL
eukprot:Plantae.Rhodophyta-Purpureofilum_apyrenoidigerum.ctg16792.p1 GENE.Plantae.Rhodophyta-Purpureofilum_apyrenoidigerum.ctg16792~~Plantae.Rhodophyta-Purpureofilum_apyrenoidigerum.ctg16792.p1  ORF type:complete len:319 (+),score=64.60 Plantae.Rhodophyta-Purpureofilum_apyrenoidigerum.ctg16792:87-959(+)